MGVISCIAQSEQAQLIKTSPEEGWTTSIGTGDLVSGAGSDLISTYESDVAQVVISISDVVENAAWRVDVSRDSGSWNNNLTLSARRTGAGLGGGSIAGGDSYGLIDTVGYVLFSGTGNRSDITIQMKLSGISLQIPPNTDPRHPIPPYTTTITYTLVEL